MFLVFFKSLVPSAKVGNGILARHYVHWASRFYTTEKITNPANCKYNNYRASSVEFFFSMDILSVELQNNHMQKNLQKNSISGSVIFGTTANL